MIQSECKHREVHLWREIETGESERREITACTSYTSLSSHSFLTSPRAHLNDHLYPSLFFLSPSLFLPMHSHLNKINRSSRITLPPSPTSNSPYMHTHTHTHTQVERGEELASRAKGDGEWRVGILRELNAWMVCSLSSSHYFSPLLYYT